MNQINSKFKIIILVVFALILSGCAIPVKQDSINGEPKSSTLSISFPKKDPITLKPFNFSLDKYDFSKELVSFSKYGHAGVYRNGVTYGGLQIKKSGNNYIAKYRNGQYLSDIKKIFSTDIIFTIESKILSNNKVQFTLINDYKIIPRRNLIGVEQSLLDQPSNIIQDITKIIEKTSSIELTQNFSYELTGEINVNYPPESIYANYDRILGKYSWRKDELIKEYKKENTYSLEHNQNTYPVNIVIYPYKNGSKVIYKTPFKYQLSSNGKSTSSLSTIEYLESVIKNTATN